MTSLIAQSWVYCLYLQMKVTELVIRFHLYLAASPSTRCLQRLVYFFPLFFFFIAVENDRTSNRDKMNRILSDVKLNILFLKLNDKRFLKLTYKKLRRPWDRLNGSWKLVKILT